VHERGATRPGEIVETNPGDERQVARDERQDAGRDEAQQPRAKGERECDVCRTEIEDREQAGRQLAARL